MGKLTELEGATMTNKAIEQLATYFSGSNVAAASIALELGGHARTMAEPYFAMRQALGIQGYADRAEALRRINASLRSQSTPGTERDGA